MNRIITFFLSFLMIGSLFSQVSYNQKVHPGYGWLLDSVYLYESEVYSQNQTLWKVTHRNANDFQLRLEESEYNFETQEYDLSYFVEYEYPTETDSNEYYEVWNFIYNEIPTPEYRFYTHHEENGYETTSTEYWDDELWVNGNKERNYYNNIYRTLHSLKYERPNNTVDWQLRSENKDTFNSDSTIQFGFICVNVNDLIDTVKKSYTYFNENINPYLYQRYNKEEAEWMMDAQSEYFYNDKHQILKQLNVSFENGQLIKDDSISYEYDIDDFLKSEKSYRWEEDENFWESGRRKDYMNDENGNLLEYTFFWGRYDTSWLNDEKRIYQYDENNRVTYFEQWEADILDPSWRKVKRFYYYYSNDQQESQLYQKWDDDLIAYRDFNAWEKDFDEQGRVIEIRHYYTDTPPYELELTSKTNITYTESENQYIISYVSNAAVSLDTTVHKIEYFNKYTTGVTELLPTEFQINPNPATDQIKLSSDHYLSQYIGYEIFSLSGQEIRSGKVNASGIIDIRNILDGQYLLRVYKPNGKTETLKFLKQ